MCNRGRVIMRIVLLLGPSSVGKSVISEELQARYQWKVLSFDGLANKIRTEQSAAIIEELEHSGLINKLAQYMSKQEALQLCQTGLLTISKGKHLIQKHQFSDPSYPHLEQILKEAGFTGDDLRQVTTNLLSVGKIFQAHNDDNIDITINKTFDRLFAEAISGKFAANDTIIFDIIPLTNDSVNKLLSAFQKHFDIYRLKYQNMNLTAFATLVYCSLQCLSNRIIYRNHEAELKSDLTNIRRGLFPFQQLSTLLVAKKEGVTLPGAADTFSKDELLKLTYIHRPLLSNEMEAKKGITLFRKAANSAVAYVKLTKQFGFWKTEQERISLVVRGDLRFDLIINSTTKDIKSIANEIDAAVKVKYPEVPNKPK